MMTSRLAKAAVFALIILCSTGAQYGSTQDDIARVYELILRAERVSSGEEARNLLEEARSYYKRARNGLAERRDRPGALELLSIAEIKARHAIALSEVSRSLGTIADLRDKLGRLKAAHRERRAELAANVARLEQLRDRQSVAQDILRSKAINSAEKAEKKIREAREAAADELAPALYAKAAEHWEEASRSLRSGDFSASLRLSDSAFQYALKAHEESERHLGFKRKLAPELSSIYGVEVEETRLGLKLLLTGVFSPRAESILFDARPTLDAIIEALNRHPEPRLSILAYSGAGEPNKRNLSLADRRANNLREYLLTGGIAEERFAAVEGTVGKGSRGAQLELSITAPLPASREPLPTAEPEGKGRS